MCIRDSLKRLFTKPSYHLAEKLLSALKKDYSPCFKEKDVLQWLKQAKSTRYLDKKLMSRKDIQVSYALFTTKLINLIKLQTTIQESYLDDTKGQVLHRHIIFRCKEMLRNLNIYQRRYPMNDQIFSSCQRSVENVIQYLEDIEANPHLNVCLLYTSPSPRDRQKSRMPSSA
eukprot:TRINITY_DN7215_c0_g3_i1.p1 TRINITY_DN7215_c0_g3~~TRINITY_DN7215_c0_g3_i1.p1  ORF type:complete len:172 (+),score=15.58 TRINITY_DN7215_c0_g3_i1:63-578(+)